MDCQCNSHHRHLWPSEVQHLNKATGAVLIKWVGNNSPRIDDCIFCQDVQSIVSINCRAVSVLSRANLKPGDANMLENTTNQDNAYGKPW